MEVIEHTQLKNQQLAILGFIFHEGKKYYLKDRFHKTVDVKDITLDEGDIIATNGVFNYVLTLDYKQAKRSTLTAKNKS